jgi:hypothetical protein
MLEENLERTISYDPYQQMREDIKRCLGLNIYFKIKNPSGDRIQKIFIGNEEVRPSQYYSAAFITSQGVEQKFGRNRENQSERIIDAMRKYLISHHPLHEELRGKLQQLNDLVHKINL